MKNKCFRCGAKANQTWNICADGNIDKHICTPCDIQLNTMVLIFMGFRNWRSKIERYIKKI